MIEETESNESNTSRLLAGKTQIASLCMHDNSSVVIWLDSIRNSHLACTNCKRRMQSTQMR